MPAPCCRLLSLAQNRPTVPGTPAGAVPPAAFRCPVPSANLALIYLPCLPFPRVFLTFPVSAPHRCAVADCRNHEDFRPWDQRRNGCGLPRPRTADHLRLGGRADAAHLHRHCPARRLVSQARPPQGGRHSSPSDPRRLHAWRVSGAASRIHGERAAGSCPATASAIAFGQVEHRTTRRSHNPPTEADVVRRCNGQSVRISTIRLAILVREDNRRYLWCR
jgi:hypothetical protein